MYYKIKNLEIIIRQTTLSNINKNNGNLKFEKKYLFDINYLRRLYNFVYNKYIKINYFIPKFYQHCKFFEINNNIYIFNLEFTFLKYNYLITYKHKL